MPRAVANITTDPTLDTTVHVRGVMGLVEVLDGGNVAMRAVQVTSDGTTIPNYVYSHSDFNKAWKWTDAGALSLYWKVRRAAAQSCRVQSAFDSLNTVSVSRTSSQREWVSGAIPLPDGRVALIGHVNTNPASTTSFSAYIYIVDLRAKTLTPIAYKTYTVTSSGSIRYFLTSTGGVMLPDQRRLFICPGLVNNSGAYSTSAHTYDIITGTTVTLGFGGPGLGITAAIVMPNNRVFCVPMWNAPIVYNPNDDTYVTPPGDYGIAASASPGGQWSIASSYWGGSLLADGRVICAPYYSTTARIYDHVSNATTTPSVTFPGNGAFRGCVTMLDGQVFFVPHNSTTARIWDPVANTLSTPGGTYPGDAACAGGLLLPDGRVYCTAYKWPARIYDPYADSVSSVPMSKGATTGYSLSGPGTVTLSSYGSALLPNGKALVVTGGDTGLSQAVAMANTGGWGTLRLAPGIRLSPYCIGHSA